MLLILLLASFAKGEAQHTSSEDCPHCHFALLGKRRSDLAATIDDAGSIADVERVSPPILPDDPVADLPSITTFDVLPTSFEVGEPCLRAVDRLVAVFWPSSGSRSPPANHR